MTPDELRRAAELLDVIRNPTKAGEARNLSMKLRALADQRSPKPYDQRKIHGPNR
jgi:hypothetical protein